MTEAEWLVCDEQKVILRTAAEKSTARKVRLALCACLRAPQVWPLLIPPISRTAVEIGEAFADGGVSREQLGAVRKRANAVARKGWGAMAPCTSSAYLANYVCMQDHNLMSFLHATDGFFYQHPPSSHLLRDIFGNPFRPVTFSSAWRSETVVSLAAGIYAERAFDQLPILADALEEAGCDHADVLSHCRGPGPHVRGCWVVDGVLGKE